MKWPWQRVDDESDEAVEVLSFSADNPPEVRNDARTYVAHGDNVWGNSIMSRSRGEHEEAVSGWLSRAPFPQTGDRLLMKMQSGKWGIYVFGEVGKAQGVSDMFQGTAYGAIGYSDQEPQTKSCDEFITDKSVYARA